MRCLVRLGYTLARSIPSGRDVGSRFRPPEVRTDRRQQGRVRGPLIFSTSLGLRIRPEFPQKLLPLFSELSGCIAKPRLRLAASIRLSLYPRRLCPLLLSDSAFAHPPDHSRAANRLRERQTLGPEETQNGAGAWLRVPVLQPTADAHALRRPFLHVTLELGSLPIQSVSPSTRCTRTSAPSGWARSDCMDPLPQNQLLTSNQRSLVDFWGKPLLTDHLCWF